MSDPRDTILSALEQSQAGFERVLDICKRMRAAQESTNCLYIDDDTEWCSAYNELMAFAGLPRAFGDDTTD